MKHASCWLLAALALCWTLSGCEKTPAEPEQPAADAAEAVAPVAGEALPMAADAAALAEAGVAAEPALSDAEAAQVVAKVNDVEITEGEIQKVLGMFTKQMGQRIPPDQLATALPRIRERIVEELVMRRIMLEEVAKQGIGISDSEFAEIKAELAEELPPDVTLESYMEETGTTEAEMREQMAVRKMIMAKAESIAKPTDEEIQAFYDENKEGFAQGESVTASHILIKVDPADDETAKAAKRERLEGLRKQLQEGADFAELAQANSDCPSASSGGDLGSFGKGQMVPAFEDAAFAQPVGSVGEVVETQFGFHLIKVAERAEAKTLDFAEVKPRISEIIYSQKQQDAVKAYVDGLREQANVQRFDEPPAEETMLQLDVEDEAVEVSAPVAIVEAPPAEVVVPAVVEEAPAVVEAAVEEAAASVEAAAEVAGEETAAVVEEVPATVEAAVEDAAASVEAAVEDAVEAAPEAVPAPAEQAAETVPPAPEEEKAE